MSPEDECTALRAESRHLRFEKVRAVLRAEDSRLRLEAERRRFDYELDAAQRENRRLKAQIRMLQSGNERLQRAAKLVGRRNFFDSRRAAV